MAAVDFFLKIESPGIDGESEDSKHKNEIEILSWGWSESNAGTFQGGGGGGAGKVSMQDFHFSMPMNKASPKLAAACAQGTHIGKATLVCRKAGDKQQEFLKITMSDLLVSSYSTGGGGGGGGDVLPTEQISMNFAKIEWEYSPQDSKGALGGAIKAGYDLKKNEKV